jgi:hypothetical protein
VFGVYYNLYNDKASSSHNHDGTYLTNTLNLKEYTITLNFSNHVASGTTTISGLTTSNRQFLIGWSASLALLNVYALTVYKNQVTYGVYHSGSESTASLKVSVYYV